MRPGDQSLLRPAVETFEGQIAGDERVGLQPHV